MRTGEWAITIICMTDVASPSARHRYAMESVLQWLINPLLSFLGYHPWQRLRRTANTTKTARSRWVCLLWTDTPLSHAEMPRTWWRSTHCQDNRGGPMINSYVYQVIMRWSRNQLLRPNGTFWPGKNSLLHHAGVTIPSIMFKDKKEKIIQQTHTSQVLIVSSFQPLRYLIAKIDQANLESPISTRTGTVSNWILHSVRFIVSRHFKSPLAYSAYRGILSLILLLEKCIISTREYRCSMLRK